MTLTYVLRNFRRRKVRTILMILSLMVGVGTLVALNATVDSYRRYFTGTVAAEVGDFDLVLSRPDTAANPFLDAERLLGEIGAVPGVVGVAPRVHAIVQVRAGAKDGESAFVALDPALDRSGTVEIAEGEYDLSTSEAGVPGAVVLQSTADVLGLALGDPIEIQYAPPQTRLAGQPADANSSRRRSTATWEVRGIGSQRGLTGQSANEGVIVDLAAARERFGLGDTAERLIVELDPALYDSRNPERSAFNARQVGFAIRERLGSEDYQYLMPRPRAVIDGANQFIFWQSLITMYGLLSLSVVGMLIRTLVMTNVQEQTRDMAILRILGSPRRRLFNLVMAEVAAIGLIGVGLGIVIGQAVNNLLIVPFMAQRAAGFVVETPLVTASSVILAVLLAGIVLAVSTWEPANRAASTKVTHAINPGVAEGIGLDDLEKMRERRTDLRVSGWGLVILCYPLLIFYIFPLAFDFGILWVLAGLIFGALLALIVGAALVFYIVILPMERLLLALIGSFAPRVGYFVRRTVLRGKVRNTLISLMIVMSALLPTFLSTTLALEVANTENDRRLSGGAPIRISPPRALDAAAAFRTETESEGAFALNLLEQVRAEPGFAATLGRSASYRTELRDGVGMRDAQVRVMGIDADPRPVLYPEAVEIIAGDPAAPERLAREPGTAIIGAGLATHLDRGPGDTLILQGEGRDHTEELVILAVAKRMGGLGEFTAKQTSVWSGETTVLTGMDSFRALTQDPLLGPPDPLEPVVATLLARPVEGQEEQALTGDLRLRYATEHDLNIDSTQETIETVREESRTGQIFLIILTALTSVLAVFGVFAVIYVSIYGRRGEIGMLKAIGSPGRHLLAVFVGEAMVMTLSATLTGVTAGVVLAYTFRLSEGFRNETPTAFAIDPVVVPAMLILMILASLVSAVVATHSYRRRRAIDILRTL